MPNWLKVTVGVVAITGLAVTTVLTGGTAGVICGAALSGAITGGLVKSVAGAIKGGCENGLEGAVDGACEGFMSGTLIGGATGALSAGVSIASGAVEVVGSAQKTGTLFHRAASNIKAGQMAANPIKYKKVTLNRCLNTAGLKGRKIPDVIGICRDGRSLLVEVVSKSQTHAQMEAKCIDMCSTIIGAKYKVIDWAANISRALRR